MTGEYVVRTSADLRELRAKLDNPMPILKAIGTLMVSVSQRSFTDQRLGDVEWSERYPNQAEPFLNIAGAVSDWAAGGDVKSRRFDRRPALLDRGLLRQSIAWRPKGRFAVETGSVLPYADIHQHGGTSEQEITETVRAKVVAFLLTERGAPYRKKLKFLLTTAFLQTEVVARPYLGITDETESDIREIIEKELAN